LPIFAFIAGDLIFQYLGGASANGTDIQRGRLSSILNRPTSGWFFGKGYFAALCLASEVSLNLKGFVTRQALAFYLLMLPILAVVPLTGDHSPIILMLTASTLSGLVILASLRRHRGKVLLALAALLLAYGFLLSQQTVVQERSALLVDQLENFWRSHYGQITIAASQIFTENWPSGVGVKSFGGALRSAEGGEGCLTLQRASARPLSGLDGCRGTARPAALVRLCPFLDLARRQAAAQP
jgi:hypothetical protein